MGCGSHSKFLFTDGSYGYGKVFVFGADMTHLCMLIIREKIS